MARYIEKQPHRHTCGLVSVINALKWLRKPKNYFDIYRKYKRNNIKVDSVNALEFEVFLADLGVKYRYLKNARIIDIEYALDNGHGVILFYKYYLPDPEGHFVFIDHHSKDEIRAHNPSKRIDLSRKQVMQDLLDHNYKRETETGIWIIKSS